MHGATIKNLLFITRDVSQFGNFISSLLICHVHVRPHTHATLDTDVTQK
jgi:hypothetical protein